MLNYSSKLNEWFNLLDSSSWAYEISCRLLASSLPRRWSHVQGVANRAMQACLIFPLDDQKLLVEAAILHDIGYSSELSRTGFHALDGASYLSDFGKSARLCALVAHHSCAWREAGLRGLSGELSRWEDEESPLRDALWWADMTTTPDGELTNVFDRIDEIQRRYGPEDLVTFFIRQAKLDLVAAVERTEDRLRVARGDQIAK